MKKTNVIEKYVGMVFLNENKRVFRMCDVEVDGNELVLNIYGALNS